MEEKPPPAVEVMEEMDDAEGPLRIFVGLFVVPLLVVLVCVGVFVGFGWIAYERNDINDYLNDLKSAWRPRRAQAAYELSKILMADPQALASAPGAQEQVRDLFVTADDEVMRGYLALVLGRSGDPEAVPTLLGAVDESDSQTRIYILMALGETADPRAVDPLIDALTDEDPGVRKTAAFALGELSARDAAQDIEPLLNDPTADVRWNAALSLAKLGSDSGVAVLEQMLDRELTSQVPGITPEQQEEAMVSAVKALAVVDGGGARELFETLAAADPSLKVRQAAIEAGKAVAGK